MRRLVLAGTLFLLCACGPAATPTPAPAPPTVSPTPLVTASNTLPSSTSPQDPAAAVDAAKADAAAQLGVPPDQLSVDQVVAQEWPDSSLGCPQPGQLYSQIVTPGFLVVITSGSRRLEYHTDARSRVKLCSQS